MSSDFTKVISSTSLQFAVSVNGLATITGNMSFDKQSALGSLGLTASSRHDIKSISDYISLIPPRSSLKHEEAIRQSSTTPQNTVEFMHQVKRRKALELFDLADVWGVGRQTFEKLRYYGIKTPLEFADKSESWVRQHFTKPGFQTWLELNGHPCIDTHEIARNQSICTSRSFGQMIDDLPSMRSAVASFAASCANKLRGQSAVGTIVSVFVCTNRFREDHQQYNNSASVTLVTPTSDTIEITTAAIKALEQIYLPKIWYKKCGVIISDIQPARPVQMSLFDPISNRPQREALMQAIDRLNHRYGLKTITLSTEGPSNHPWKVKSEQRTPNYLTDLDELLVIKI